MEIPFLYISLLLLLASYLFTSHFRRRTTNLPPTVFPSFPIIGHLYLLKPPLFRTLAKIAAKYGPIVYLRFGSRRVLLVSSPSAAEECLTKNDITFANRPQMLFGKILGMNYTTLAWSSYGHNWRNLRRIASIEILSIHRLNELLDVRTDEGKHLIRKLLSNYSSPVAVKSIFYEHTLNVMMRMISGKRYFNGDKVDEEGKEFNQILRDTFLYMGASNVGDYLPFLSWLGVNDLEKKLLALKERRDVFFQGLIEELRKGKGDNQVGNKRKTMIEVLLSLQESDPEYYTDEMIQNFVVVILIGGTDNSSGTMEWVLSLLLNHPQVLKRAQNEIDIKVGKDRLVEESDLPNLPYLRCIINETFRLFPPGPILVPHESSDDCVVGGYNIPRGTMLIVNQWAIQHDPKVWTDPKKFNPERFQGIEGSRDGFKLLPFGFGRRSCPGDVLAVRMIAATLALIIQCFDWERTSEAMVDMREGPGLTIPKAEPLVAKCKPRLEMQDLLSQL